MTKRASDSDERAAAVLVVDDDPAMRALLRDWLEREGYRVAEEPSGERLLVAARTANFDVVILDKEMSEPGGFEVLPAFRQQCPETPVILITAFGGTRVAEEALRLGAYRYLEKPFQLGAFLAAAGEVDHGRVVGRVSETGAGDHDGILARSRDDGPARSRLHARGRGASRARDADAPRLGPGFGLGGGRRDRPDREGGAPGRSQS